MIKTGAGIVGHVQREYSTPCNVVIQSGGIVTCIFTGSHQHALIILMGVLCWLVFKGNKEILKTAIVTKCISTYTYGYKSSYC